MSFVAMEGSRRGSKIRLFYAGSWVILLLFLLQFAAGQQQQQQHQTLLSTERAALLDLRSSLGIQSKDWPIKANPCTNWTGISCQDGRVTGINISGFMRTRLGRQNPRFAVDALGNFTQLTSFNASGFLLPGPIPDWLGSRVSSLESLDLRSCSLTGSIPSSLGSLSRLQTLYLSDNSLTGSIDSSLGQLGELSALNLSGNLLTGSIPDAFSTLAHLTVLDLSSNFISGSIPPSLGSVSGLRVLNLSDNSLTYSFPVLLSNLSMLTHLGLSKNSISGFLPAELSGLTSLQVLRIGNNNLSGQLPNNLFSALSRLEVLDVSGNNFTGEFPMISSRKDNDSAMFNFSNNMFYGTLNSSLLEFSGSLDLSGNYFQGNVSTNGGGGYNVSLERNCLQIVERQRSLLDCREFYAKIGLVFDDFGAPQPSDPPLSNDTARKNGRLWVDILIAIGSVLGFILLLVFVIVFLLRRSRRGESSGQRARNVDVEPVTAGESATIPKEPSIVPRVGDSFTYEQMLRATSDFNDSNLIKKGHSGDLYLGLLDGWAPVVIKRIQGTGSGLLTGKKESYAVELEFFGRASHVRLIPLLGHCLELEQEKFLVYKYMPNGDLASSFFRATESDDGSFQSLDWITRLKIAIGAAEGLTYMHHECSPPLVHRDVRASSILLDDKFEVRLGSLSEIHAQEGDAHHNVIARLLRKPQTSEQGPSGPSTATCAFDVFCFGKILLELITGKIGIGQSDDATSEWLEQTLPFISSFDKEPVTRIVDPSLIVDEDLLEEVWAMAIVAKSCLNPKPAKRPHMKHILKALENPLKVVREGSNSGSSSRLRNSSMRSWSTGFFGSWRQSSSGSAANPGHFNSGFKQSGRVGSQSSGGNDHSSSNKRASSEIFPEPVTITDMETSDGH